MGILWTAILVGAAQLIAGMALGWYFAYGRRNRARVSADARRVLSIAVKLDRLAGTVSNDVERHRDEMRIASDDLESLAARDGEQLADAVVATVGRIVDVNERLERRLVTAETNLRQQSEKLQAYLIHAQTDSLTGLANRRALTAEVGRVLTAGIESEPRAWLVVMDIDFFKRLNDTYGHAAGDLALCEVADRLQSSVRISDLAARIGGEEFAVLLPGAVHDNARRVVERIRHAVANAAVPTDRGDIRMTVSLGLAQFQPDDSYESAFRRADAALYAAKHNGRNRGFFHNGCECFQICPSDGPEPSAPTSSFSEYDCDRVHPERVRAQREPPEHVGPSSAAPDTPVGESSPTRSGDVCEPPPSQQLLHLCDDLRTRLQEVLQPGDGRPT